MKETILIPNLIKQQRDSLLRHCLSGERVVPLLAAVIGYPNHPWVSEKSIVYVQAGYVIADKDSNTDNIILPGVARCVLPGDVQWEKQELEKWLEDKKDRRLGEERAILGQVLDQWSHGVIRRGYRIHNNDRLRNGRRAGHFSWM